MIKRNVKYGDAGKRRAKFEAVNHLGQIERDSKIFHDPKTAMKEADEWLEEREKIFREKGTIGSENLTFAVFVECKKKTHFHEAVIRNGKKISGYKGFKKVTKYVLKSVIDYFGKAEIRKITSHDCEVFKIDRLNTPTYKDTERSVASVNRELAMLRKILNLAVKDRVINFAPVFEINLADENMRSRVLSLDEEKRLIMALESRNKQNKQTLIHLKPLVFTALNTACRAGELLKLRWNNVNFAYGVLQILGTNTKTQQYREVPFSSEVREELLKLHEKKQSDDELVFNISYYSDGFRALLKEAKIYDFRFHDLRHTATTNFVKSEMRTELCMSITGHTTERTFRRYVNFKTEDLTKEYAKYEAFKIERDQIELVTEANN